MGLSFPTQGIAAHGMTSLKAWVRMLAPRHPLFEAICRKLRRSSAAVATNARRPPLAKIRPGSPAPAMGPGTAHAVERKGRVKRWTRCRSGANDVGADPQPVRVQHLISCPTLKIGEAAGERRSRWHNRPRCREPKKLPAVGNFHLRDEEVVIRRQIKRRCKVHCEFYFRPGYRTVAAGSLTRRWMYTARLDAVVCREGTQSLSLEAKRSRGRIAAVQCHVRWRVNSRRHLGRRKYGPARPAHVRIVGKNPIYFDDYLADGRVAPP